MIDSEQRVFKVFVEVAHNFFVEQRSLLAEGKRVQKLAAKEKHVIEGR